MRPDDLELIDGAEKVLLSADAMRWTPPPDERPDPIDRLLAALDRRVQPKPRHHMLATTIAQIISDHRFRYANERDLQQALATLLEANFENVRAEVRLSPADRVDFMIGKVAIEVKVATSAEVVERQLRRYAYSDQVAWLVLVTTRASHLSLPTTINDKPLQVVNVGSPW